MTRKFLSVILGIFVSFLVLSICVDINVHFTNAALLAKYSPEQISNDLGIDPFTIVENTVWRLTYIFGPLTVLITALIVTVVNKRAAHMLVLLSLAPFFFLVILSNDFSLSGFVLLTIYLLLALATGVLAGSFLSGNTVLSYFEGRST